jgi:aryl-alcohol dehydrogenase-like predicted oxidoreductase
MNTRELGRTGIVVSEIGLGSWQLGSEAWRMDDEAECFRMVDAALDVGCNLFDTAPGYGGGRSEEILGRAFQGRRERVLICTKFGHTPDGPSDFRLESIRPALEGSLKRLQTDHVDVYLLHNPPAEMLDGRKTPHYEELENLKAEGKLRAYGVSVDHGHEVETVLSTTPCQAIEILFNALHQDALSTFEKAHALGVGLIAKVPLDSGWLTGKYGADSAFTDIRRRWSHADIQRRAALVEKFTALLPENTSIMQGALQYILAQPQVSTVIPGARSVAQVTKNANATSGRLPDAVVDQIHALWEREIKSDPLPW